MSKTTNGPTARLTHIFCDVDGCLLPGKGDAAPLEEMARLRKLLAAHSELGFSLCTGRPIPYVEAMTQVLGLCESQLAQVCEGGAALYWPGRDLPGRGGTEAAYELLGAFDRTTFLSELGRYLEPTAFRVEPGKMGCLSLYPSGGWTVGALHARMLAGHPGVERFNLMPSSVAVDITPAGVDKASGIREACRRMGLELSAVVCIGDSENDLPMLELAGLAACPANASEPVMGVAGLVAKGAATAGVVEIVERVVKWNSMQ
jgi:hydroxymethylpyrimidine pyrophosphatase-like HAD family hydrolase